MPRPLTEYASVASAFNVVPITVRPHSSRPPPPHPYCATPPSISLSPRVNIVCPEQTRGLIALNIHAIVRETRDAEAGRDGGWRDVQRAMWYVLERIVLWMDAANGGTPQRSGLVVRSNYNGMRDAARACGKSQLGYNVCARLL